MKKQLSKNLDHVHSRFKSEVKIIMTFLTDTHKFTESRAKARRRCLKEDDKASIEEFKNILGDIIKNKKQHYKIQASKRVESLILTVVSNMKYETFSSEMTLIYLLTFYEGFVKDYLKTILTTRREILRSKKNITFEEVTSFKSMDRLIEHMADKEVDSLAYESVDDVVSYFEDKFNIQIEQVLDCWPVIREAAYRRNLVVHNKGITNRIYCSKVGYKKTGVHLQTDKKYVIKACEAVITFMDYIHKQMKYKFVPSV